MKWLAMVAALYAGIASARADDVPGARLVTLARGVNILETFDNKKTIPAIVDDLKLIQHSGLRHIRIFVDKTRVDQPTAMERLDKTVDAAIDLKLGVILCMVGKDDFIDDPQMISDYTAAWTGLAQRYKDRNPDLLYPELVNEPAIRDTSQWVPIQEKLRQTVRGIMAQNTILLTASPTSTSWSLSAMPASADPNVVYVFHDYAPMVFTHQGADWGDDGFWTIHNLRYPPSPENVTDVSRKAMAKLRPDLDRYSKATNIVDRELGPAIAWAYLHKAHLMVTEFGVFRPAPADSRVQWFKDVRTALDRAGIGWTVWEYNAGFGIKSELATKSCVPLKQALGLCH